MAHIWSDLSQGRKYKSPSRHCRMRNRKFGRFHHRFSIEQNVDVDRAWPLFQHSLTTETALDLKQAFDQVRRRDFRFDRRHTVQEQSLLGELDRFRLVERRDGLD